jgi:hypothetical protein
MSKPRYLMVAVGLFILGIALLSLPSIIRRLPGRYASRLPAPLLALRHSDHPISLPTPIATETTSPAADPTSTATPAHPPSPTAEPDNTRTPEPPEATQPPTAVPQPTSTLPPSVLLDGLRHERQGWNNCGPTTLAMALSYWGFDDSQVDIAPIVKPDPEDKHVGIHQMADYATGLGLNAVIRSGGTLAGLRTLLAARYPVLIESWYVRDAQDQLGHYRLIVGYNDATQHFDLFDSLYDPPTTMAYQELYELWRVFNWTYMVIAPPELYDEIATLAGPDMQDTAMYERALTRAYDEAARQPESCAAYAVCSDWVTMSWFTIGSNLTALGRHAEAVEAYDQARQLGLHYRMLWYQFGPYESYHAVGRHDDVIALASATLATAGNLEESYLWRGRSRLALDDTAGAESDFRAALTYHEGWQPALTALEELEQ